MFRTTESDNWTPATTPDATSNQQGMFGLGNKGFTPTTQAPSVLTPGQLINGSARDTQAALAREEWEDYKSRFFPLEEGLIAQYDNAAMREQAMGQNAQAVNRAYDADQGVQQRRLSRYSVSLAPDQKQALERQNQVSRVAALTDVRNLTRDAYADLDNQILTGSSASTSEIAREA